MKTGVFKAQAALAVLPFAAASLALVFAACAEADREHEFESLNSPRNDFQLIATVIEPWFPQGPHQVAVYVRIVQTGLSQQVAKTELAYDGIPFTKNNIAIRWISDEAALVCLRATDRPDKGVRVTVHQGQPKAELRAGC